MKPRAQLSRVEWTSVHSFGCPVFESGLKPALRHKSPVASSCQIQPPHRSRRRREPFFLDAHPLEHRDKEIRQRIILRAAEREVLPMLEAAACENRRHVEAGMRVGIAEV